MKAPEKIYVSIHSGIHHYEQKNEDDIEYVRANAFIEKATKWINEHTSLSEKMVVENFVKYMEGE